MLPTSLMTPNSPTLRELPAPAQMSATGPLPRAADLAVGHPRFPGDLAALAKREGALAAWRVLFARDGAAAPAQVQGDFAVALRLPDGRSFLAVDRFAVRTLCWRVQAGQLSWNERADSLAGERPDIDVQALFDYLYFHVVPSPRTVYAGVSRLPAACCAVWERGALTVQTYWHPHFAEAPDMPLAQRKAQFLELVEQAVARRAGEGVGCFLSGGTDSSTVAGMLKRSTGTARTFSIGFDQAGYDEMAFSRIAARHFGAEHHEYYITPQDLVDTVPQAAASYDQPFGNSSMVPAYHCARMAREAGVTQLLGGDGGDELFGGNTRYAKQRVFGIYDYLPGALQRGVFEPLFADNRVANALPVVRKLGSYVRQARVPMPDRMQSWNLLERLGVKDVLAGNFLAQVDTAAPLAHQRAVWAQCDAPSLVNRMLAYDWRYTLAETDLPKVVGATRLAGLPVHFPLLDDALVDFSLSLPASYKVRGLKLRWFFKEALRGFLPDEIIVKKKQGFGLPFGPWTVAHAGLNALARDSVEGLVERGVLRADFARELFARWLPEHPHYYGEMIWIAMMLEQWLRAHAPHFRVR